MAFADAIFDGRTTLDGAEAIRVDELDAVSAILARHTVVPIVVGDFNVVLGLIAPDVLIDARMRKRDSPETQRGLSPLTIGLGPNFVAGETTDVVVETSWEQLGRVVTRGTALPLQGEPRAIAGHGRDRYVYAPVTGTLFTACAIGQQVAAGEIIARIDATSLTAPLSGVLRGLTHDGVPVAAGTLAFLNHNGPHVISPLDWKTFLDFADRHLPPIVIDDLGLECRRYFAAAAGFGTAWAIG